MLYSYGPARQNTNALTFKAVMARGHSGPQDRKYRVSNQRKGFPRAGNILDILVHLHTICPRRLAHILYDKLIYQIRQYFLGIFKIAES